jgi:hypothetical protein
MIPRYIFCKCMKPWILCVNKKSSYQIDVRDLINTYNMPPYYHVGKDSILYNPKFSLNYDFINGKMINDTFKCRFLNDKASDCKPSDCKPSDCTTTKKCH